MVLYVFFSSIDLGSHACSSRYISAMAHSLPLPHDLHTPLSFHYSPSLYQSKPLHSRHNLRDGLFIPSPLPISNLPLSALLPLPNFDTSPYINLIGSTRTPDNSAAPDPAMNVFAGPAITEGDYYGFDRPASAAPGYVYVVLVRILGSKFMEA
jgi:hypothetical protein